MRKLIVNILATTGISLIALSTIAALAGGSCLFLSSVFESLGVNILIHLGFILTRKFECRYAIVESLLDISLILALLIIFGAIFNWYTSTPIWMLVILAVVVYACGLLISVFRSRENLKEINQLLQKNNQHM